MVNSPLGFLKTGAIRGEIAVDKSEKHWAGMNPNSFFSTVNSIGRKREIEKWEINEQKNLTFIHILVRDSKSKHVRNRMN